MRRWLGWVLLSAGVFGLVLALAGCAQEEKKRPGDNTRCHPEGFDEFAVRGRLRISFAYEGGTVRASSSNLPATLICEVLPKGKCFDAVTDEVVDCLEESACPEATR